MELQDYDIDLDVDDKANQIDNNHVYVIDRKSSAITKAVDSTDITNATKQVHPDEDENEFDHDVVHKTKSKGKFDSDLNALIGKKTKSTKSSKNSESEKEKDKIEIKPKLKPVCIEDDGNDNSRLKSKPSSSQNTPKVVYANSKKGFFPNVFKINIFGSQEKMK